MKKLSLHRSSIRFAMIFAILFIASGVMFNLPKTRTIVFAGDAEDVLALVNAERAAAGQSPLALSCALNNAALRHANDMVDNGFFDHTGSDGSSAHQRIMDAGYGGSSTGENIAWGYTSAASVMAGWMGSDGHRANILRSNFQHMGLARVGNHWVQTFGGGGTTGCGSTTTGGDTTTTTGGDTTTTTGGDTTTTGGTTGGDTTTTTGGDTTTTGGTTGGDTTTTTGGDTTTTGGTTGGDTTGGDTTGGDTTGGDTTTTGGTTGGDTTTTTGGDTTTTGGTTGGDTTTTGGTTGGDTTTTGGSTTGDSSDDDDDDDDSGDSGSPTDSRMNTVNPSAPVALYCVNGSVDVYAVRSDGTGVQAVTLSPQQISNGVQAAQNTGQNVLLGEGNGAQAWVTPAGELQVSAGEVNQSGQVYTFSGSASMCGSLPTPNGESVNAGTSTTTGAAQPATPPQQTYTVQAGDTLFRVALRFGVTVSELSAANNLTDPNQIVPGQQLAIPSIGLVPPEFTADGGGVVPPSSATTTSSGVTAPPLTDNPASGAAAGATHVVQSGETLFDIALAYGVDMSAIMAANNLSSMRDVQPGQQLVIPLP